MVEQAAPPKFWMYPLQFIFALLFWFAIVLPGKILAFIIVPVGILTGWRYKITWAWYSIPEKERTGTYYDPWYANMQSRAHGKLSRWMFQHSDFTRQYYWRTRNGFSNGMRWMIKNPAHEFTIYTKDFTGGYYQYCPDKWWFAKLRIAKPRKGSTSGKGFTYYLGWKFERSDGFGFTHRLPKYENI